MLGQPHQKDYTLFHLRFVNYNIQYIFNFNPREEYFYTGTKTSFLSYLVYNQRKSEISNQSFFHQKLLSEFSTRVEASISYAVCE